MARLLTHCIESDTTKQQFTFFCNLSLFPYNFKLIYCIFILFKKFSLSFFFFFFLLYGMWDLSSLIRDQTCAHCSESVEF